MLHLFKIHGSIDWRRSAAAGTDVVIRHGTPDDAEYGDLMVYPSPLKLTEMNGYPYAEMLRHFSAHVHQPQTALFTIGYRFQDDHVNRLIYQALATPSFALIVVIPELATPADETALQREHEIWRLIHRVASKRITVILGGETDATGQYIRGAGTLQDFATTLMPDIRELDVRKIVREEMRSALPPTGGDAADEL